MTTALPIFKESYKNFCNEIDITYNDMFAEELQKYYTNLVYKNLTDIKDKNPKLWSIIYNNKVICNSYQKFILLASILNYIKKYKDDETKYENFKDKGFKELIEWGKTKINWEYEALINNLFKNYDISIDYNLFDIIYNKLVKCSDLMKYINRNIDNQTMISLLSDINSSMEISNTKEDYSKRLLNESETFHVNVTQNVEIENLDNPGNNLIFKVHDLDVGTNKYIPTDILKLNLNEIEQHNTVPKTLSGKLADIFNDFTSVELTRLNIPRILFNNLDTHTTYKIHFTGINLAQRTNISDELIFNGKFEKYDESYSFIPSSSCRIAYHPKTAKIINLDFYITKYNNKLLNSNWNLKLNYENCYNIITKDISLIDTFIINLYDINLRKIDNVYYTPTYNALEHIYSEIPYLDYDNDQDRNVILYYRNKNIQLLTKPDITLNENNYYTNENCKYLNYMMKKYRTYYTYNPENHVKRIGDLILGDYYYKTLKINKDVEIDINDRPQDVSLSIYTDEYQRVIFVENHSTSTDKVEVIIMYQDGIKIYVGTINTYDKPKLYYRRIINTSNSKLTLFKPDQYYPNEEDLEYHPVVENEYTLKTTSDKVSEINWIRDYPYGLVFKYENNEPLDEIQTSCEIGGKEYTLTFHKDYFASVNYYEVLENVNINISAMFDVDFCLTFK